MMSRLDRITLQDAMARLATSYMVMDCVRRITERILQAYLRQTQNAISKEDSTIP